MESRRLNYHFEYVNENEFRKKERAIKKYNMLAYKKLLFDYYPSLREGNFQGVLVSTNDVDKTEKYELTLPTDKTFVKVHGNITLHYTVYLEQKTVLLETLTPEKIHQKVNQLLSIFIQSEPLPEYKNLKLTNIGYQIWLNTTFEHAMKKSFGLPGFP